MKNLKNLLIVAVVVGLSIMSCTPKEIDYPEGGGCSCETYVTYYEYVEVLDESGYKDLEKSGFIITQERKLVGSRSSSQCEPTKESFYKIEYPLDNTFEWLSRDHFRYKGYDIVDGMQVKIIETVPNCKY